MYMLKIRKIFVGFRVFHIVEYLSHTSRECHRIV